MSHSPIKRVLLKLSGEALTYSNSLGIDVKATQAIIENIESALSGGVLELAIVVGGGNFIRGQRTDYDGAIHRNTADQMGMLATMINGLALRDILISRGLKAVALSAKRIDGLLDSVDRIQAQSYLSEGYIVIFCGGTGNPYVTTDSAASLRAVEIEADALLKATNVDGVYEQDPNEYPLAKKYETITFSEVLEKELSVMDISAFVQCRDFNIPICVFNMNQKSSIKNILNQSTQGTWIKKG